MKRALLIIFFSGVMLVVVFGAMYTRARFDDELRATLPRSPAGDRTIPRIVAKGTEVFMNESDLERVRKADLRLIAAFVGVAVVIVASQAWRIYGRPRVRRIGPDMRMARVDGHSPKP